MSKRAKLEKLKLNKGDWNKLQLQATSIGKSKNDNNGMIIWARS